MESTLGTHYGRFIHASQTDALELAKIAFKSQHGGVCPTERTKKKSLTRSN
jgi:hypothetical protein